MPIYLDSCAYDLQLQQKYSIQGQEYIKLDTLGFLQSKVKIFLLTLYLNQILFQAFILPGTSCYVALYSKFLLEF